MYCSSMVCRGVGGGNCGGGYPGRIRHWSRPGTLEAGPAEDSVVAWKDEGLVLEPEYNSSEWDASGTFTPGIVKDCRGQACEFYLFFVSRSGISVSHTYARARTWTRFLQLVEWLVRA